MTWQQWMSQAVCRLRYSSSPTAICDSEVLLSFVTGEIRARVFAFDDTVLQNSQLEMLELLLLRRELGEPVAYLVGQREFWSLPLRVSRDTFIPRPDTECLVQIALDLVSPDPANILDLGSGSGAISLALASERSEWIITGIDCSFNAVLIARSNAVRLGLENVQFYKGNWFETIKKHYHLIVSNPPYIRAGDPCLIKNDIRFEPHIALVGGQDGLQSLADICCVAGKYLELGGWLVLEHGWQQGQDVRDMLYDGGFNKIITLRDYSGNERVSCGQWLTLRV